MANILNGNNNSNCKENTASCYYLNAIAGARLGNETACFINLEKAINLDYNYKIDASKDLEFKNYRDYERFKSIIE